MQMQLMQLFSELKDEEVEDEKEFLSLFTLLFALYQRVLEPEEKVRTLPTFMTLIYAVIQCNELSGPVRQKQLELIYKLYEDD